MDPNELQENLRGVAPILLCPYDEGGEVDTDGLRENIEFLTDYAEGRDFVFVANGSNSEFYANSDAEQQAVIETALEASGDVPVLVGTGRASTRGTIEMTQYAESAGADGALVVLPFYRQPSREQLYEHYEAVTDAVEMGVVLYNNPFTAGCWADPNLLARLSKIDNLVGVKENAGSGGQWGAIARAVNPDDLSMICGIGEVMYPAAAVYGAVGTVSVFANFAPDLVYEFQQTVASGNYQEVREALSWFDPLYEILDETLARRESTTVLPPTMQGHPVFTSVCKYGMEYVGLNGGEVRAPMSNLTDDEKASLDRAFDEMGIEPVR